MLEWIRWGVDFTLHLDKHLGEIIAQFGAWTYAVFAVIVFCETGLVVTPFLPGDSLLFAGGAFAAKGSLNPHLLFMLIAAAAILGDTVNYWVGNFIGPKVFHTENTRFLNRKHLERAHLFYEKHGGKTIILARFIPIIRTFAPFVAGIGAMHYGKFILYNIVGGIAWAALFVYAGYFFGNLPWVKHNFTLVIMAIIVLSILPAVVEYFRHQSKPKSVSK
jgi:membrane-associated protein